MVCEWSVILEFFAETVAKKPVNFETAGITMVTLVNALFCAGAVMISYGAFLGKATPSQMLVLGILEPMFYWLNFYITVLKLEVIDVGTVILAILTVKVGV